MVSLNPLNLKSHIANSSIEFCLTQLHLKLFPLKLNHLHTRCFLYFQWALRYIDLQLLKCSFSVPSSINGDRVRAKTKRVKWLTSILFKSRLLTQWNLRSSLCDSLILICKNTSSMSPQSSTGLDLERINIFHSQFCKGGPICRHMVWCIRWPDTLH